jgi:hypothetical protein
MRRDRRGYPIIASIFQAEDEVDFGALSERRKLVLATFDLCGVCGTPFHDELRWQVTFDDEARRIADGEAVRFNEAPVHEVCALYAAQVCPFVASPYARFGDEIRKGEHRPEKVVLAGFTDTASVQGIDSELQSGEWILMFGMAGLTTTRELHKADEAAEQYNAVLAAEPPVVMDDSEWQLVEMLSAPTPEGEDPAGVLAGAAWMIGAAFCPDIGRVQAMDHYLGDRDGSAYLTLAHASLSEPDYFTSLAEEAPDLATAVAGRWVLARNGQLPTVLAAWRNDAAEGRPVPRRTTPPPRVSDRAEAARRRAAETARRRRKRR